MKIDATTEREKRRLAAIKLLKGQGHTQADVARLLGVSREAVRKWWAAYQAGGRKALKPSQVKRGPRPALTRDELVQLLSKAKELKEGGNLAGLLRVARSHLGSKISRSALRRRLLEHRLWSP